MGSIFQYLAHLVAGRCGWQLDRWFSARTLGNPTVLANKNSTSSGSNRLGRRLGFGWLAPISNRNSLRFGVFRSSATSLGGVTFWQTRSGNFSLCNVGDRAVGHVAQPWSVRDLQPESLSSVAAGVLGHRHCDFSRHGFSYSRASTTRATAPHQGRGEPDSG